MFSEKRKWKERMLTFSAERKKRWQKTSSYVTINAEHGRLHSYQAGNQCKNQIESLFKKIESRLKTVKRSIRKTLAIKKTVSFSLLFSLSPQNSLSYTHNQTHIKYLRNVIRGENRLLQYSYHIKLDCVIVIRIWPRSNGRKKNYLD